MDKTKIGSFTDLNTWKEGHKLVLLIYEVVKNFPQKEQFVLVSQMLRASISITSNVAEGFGRSGLKEKIQFYTISQGSLRELQSQLILARDLGYVPTEKFNDIWDKTIVVHKLLTGLIKSLKR